MDRWPEAMNPPAYSDEEIERMLEEDRRLIERSRALRARVGLVGDQITIQAGGLQIQITPRGRLRSLSRVTLEPRR